MSTQTFIGTLTIIECANCGITFGIPRDFEERRRNDHKSFYCPSQHRNYFPHESEVEKLRRRIEWDDRRIANLDEDVRAARASRAAVKGQLTRVKKRIGNGVCPCCNRHFVNVERHMKSQHPDQANA